MSQKRRKNNCPLLPRSEAKILSLSKDIPVPCVLTSVPCQHIAIILDGNRRWARKRGLPRLIGHRKGTENLKKLLPVFIKNNIERVTVYALSTENIDERDTVELKNLFKEIERFAKDLEIFHEHAIRLQVFGQLKKFPPSTKRALQKTIEATKKHKKLNLNVALGYSGRDEILRAVNKFAIKGRRATEKTFARTLDSSGQPDPDLLIRTGGKSRLSNFLLWQLAYSELYFTDKLWPEFDEKELLKALDWFAEQQRNFGK